MTHLRNGAQDARAGGLQRGAQRRQVAVRHILLGAQRPVERHVLQVGPELGDGGRLLAARTTG